MAQAHPPTTSSLRPSTLRSGLAPELSRLRARARRLCRNESDALDLVQDTVARALAYEASFEPGSNLHAWLECILRNLFVSRYRRLGRERRALAALGDDPCSWIHSDAPPVLGALGPHAESALSGLSEPFRRVVELVDLEELSYQDAANALGVPVGTVMSRLHRARQKLAGKLRDVEPPLAA